MKWSLILPLICVTAQGALVPALSLEELIDQSEIIVHGRVSRSWAAWDSGHKYIWTHHLISVIDPIRGNPGASLVVSEPGGALDGVGMTVSGAVRYEAGEEAILFLYRTPIGYMRVVGYGQGKYTVTADRRVRANLKGLELVRHGAPGGASLSTLEGLSVADFKIRIREAVRRRR